MPEASLSHVQAEVVVVVVHEGAAAAVEGGSPAVAGVLGGGVALGAVEARVALAEAGVGSAQAGVGGAASVDEDVAGFDKHHNPTFAVLQAEVSLQPCGHKVVAQHASMTYLFWRLA